MASINFTNAAKEDSRAIFADLETKAGAYTVEKYLTEFSRLYDHLSGFPESGAPRRKLGVTVRIGVVFPYVVFYRYVEPDDSVLVLRVLDGRRKVTRRMLQQPPSRP
jgi:toxin ParE1/3/4